MLATFFKLARHIRTTIKLLDKPDNMLRYCNEYVQGFGAPRDFFDLLDRTSEMTYNHFQIWPVIEAVEVFNQHIINLFEQLKSLEYKMDVIQSSKVSETWDNRPRPEDRLTFKTGKIQIGKRGSGPQTTDPGGETDPWGLK